jgi:hypothetical protein
MENKEELQKLIDLLDLAKGYMLTVSVLNDDQTISHSLITENFLKLDMLPSHQKTKELIIENLEEENTFLINDRSF